MKITAIAVACVVGLVSNASFALEPWHDYYTAKAMKDKAAKKCLEKADKRLSEHPRAAKETREDASKDRKEK